MSLLGLPADVQRLLLNQYLRDEDALVARCSCRTLRALVPRARLDACRHHLYAHFCAQGYVALLEWLYTLVPLRETNDGTLCAAAARAGHLAVLQWLRAHGAAWNHWTCVSAAAEGHLALLQWSRLLAGERLHAAPMHHGAS